MNSQTNKLIPELRFPDFANDKEWEHDIVDNLVKTVTPPKKLTSSNYQIDGEFPIIDQSKNFYCGWTNDINAVMTNDLPLIIFGDHTCIIKLAKEPFAQGADGIKILKAEDKIFPDYLFHYLKHNEVKMEDYKRHFSILKDKVVIFPKIENGEQQKIASCLSSLDELITAHTDKLETLKKHKKGLMQNLFPQDGEKVPKFRFKEFEKDGDWEFKEIENYIELFSGIAFKGEEISDDESGIPILRGINITEGYIRHSKDIDKFYIGDLENLKKYFVKENDIVIGMDGSKVGKNVALIRKEDENSILIQRVARIRTKKHTDTQFIYQHFISDGFRNYVDRVNTSSGIPHISSQQIKDFKISFPPKVEEQQKIADTLSLLDNLIKEQSDKIDQLKLHKKGLMQGLFPKVKN